MGKGSSVLRLQNALSCQNTHFSRKYCVCVCVRMGHECVFGQLTGYRLKCKVLLHIHMSLWVWQLFQISKFEFYNAFGIACISNKPKLRPVSFFVCVLTTSCVQAPLHNSLATVLALVHTHPSS